MSRTIVRNVSNTLTERIGEIEKIVKTQGYIEFREGTAGLFDSCISFIRDTEEALESYLTEISNQVPLERGKTILYAFGVCQAIFVQQDAVSNLCFLLDIDYPEILLIKEIREIRNDLAHPTDRWEREFGKKYSRITNVFQWGAKVDLMTSYPTLAKYTRERENRNVVMTIGFNTINIPELIEKQKKSIYHSFGLCP